MQRIRFGRISAAVAALCLAGAIQHAEDIYAMATGVDLDGAIVPGQIRVTVDDFSVLSGDGLPFAPGQFPYLGKLKCATDPRLQRRLCASRQPSDSAFSAMAITQRSVSGAPQLAFDGVTTDTIVSQSAMVQRSTDRSGHPSDRTWRSTQRWGGVSHASATMTLNGADSVFSVVHRTTGVNRFTGVVEYSDVRLARHPSNIVRSYPVSGVVHMTSTNEWVTPAATRPSYESIIVYFDGTRTPDAWLDGKRYHLDLVTGLATPYRAD